MKRQDRGGGRMRGDVGGAGGAREAEWDMGAVEQGQWAQGDSNE